MNGLTAQQPVQAQQPQALLPTQQPVQAQQMIPQMLPQMFSQTLPTQNVTTPAEREKKDMLDRLKKQFDDYKKINKRDEYALVIKLSSSWIEPSSSSISQDLYDILKTNFKEEANKIIHSEGETLIIFLLSGILLNKLHYQQVQQKVAIVKQSGISKTDIAVMSAKTISKISLGVLGLPLAGLGLLAKTISSKAIQKSEGDSDKGDSSKGDSSKGDSSKGDPSKGDPSKSDPSKGKEDGEEDKDKDKDKIKEVKDAIKKTGKDKGKDKGVLSNLLNILPGTGETDKSYVPKDDASKQLISITNEELSELKLIEDKITKQLKEDKLKSKEYKLYLNKQYFNKLSKLEIKEKTTKQFSREKKARLDYLKDQLDKSVADKLKYLDKDEPFLTKKISKDKKEFDGLRDIYIDKLNKAFKYEYKRMKKSYDNKFKQHNRILLDEINDYTGDNIYIIELLNNLRKLIDKPVMIHKGRMKTHKKKKKKRNRTIHKIKNPEKGVYSIIHMLDQNV